MPRQTRRVHPDALVQQLAEITLPPDPPDFAKTVAEDTRASQLFGKLRECVRHEGGRAPAAPDEATYDQIAAALPESLREPLRDYCDALTFEEYLTMAAAYQVGVAVGRRMGGAR